MKKRVTTVAPWASEAISKADRKKMSEDMERRFFKGGPGLKRVIYEVRYNKAKDLWFVYRNNKHVFTSGYEVKRVAVEDASCLAQEDYRYDGVLSELIIKNKNGKIGKGSSSRRTYGKDPKSKG